MKFKQFKLTWQGLTYQNRQFKILIVFLLCIILMLAIISFRREVIITLIPPMLDTQVELKRSKASQTYLSSWALYFADLIGNVTPGNVEFIQQSLSPMLSPDIYQHVIDVLLMQTQQIQEDNITLSFQPRQIEQDESNNKVFVTGYSYVSGIAGKAQRELRTYEFIISINNYAPLLIWMDTYEGQPRIKSSVNH